MLKFVLPALLVVAGGLIWLQSINAECGNAPQLKAPARCQPAIEWPPNGNPGTCQMVNGKCVSDTCSGENWGIVQPGRCGDTLFEENFVPTCTDEFGVTVYNLPKYAMTCVLSEGQCNCEWKATKTTTPVTICTCKNNN